MAIRLGGIPFGRNQIAINCPGTVVDDTSAQGYVRRRTVYGTRELSEGMCKLSSPPV